MSKTLRISDDLSLPADAVTQAIGWLGRRGSGKSYGSTKLAELMHAAGSQFVAMDPVGIWFGLRLSADGKGPGIDVPIFGGLHGDVPLEATAGSLIADLVVDRGISAVLDVSQFESDSDRARFARDFAARFFHRKKAAPSPVHVFIEESQEFIPQNPQKGEEQMLHAFQRMVRLGRNFGIGVSMISQRPQDVNKKALNQTECLFCFQLTGPQERAAVEGWVSAKGLKEDLGRLLPSLRQGNSHVWSPVWLDVNREVHIAAKETFAAGATPKMGQRPVEAKPLAAAELEKLKTDMAATVEKAKATDPKALQAKVAELQRQLQARPAAKVETKIIEKPVVTDAQVKEFKGIVAVLEREGNRRLKVSEEMTAGAKELAESGRQLVQQAQQFVSAMARAAASPVPMASRAAVVSPPAAMPRPSPALRPVIRSEAGGEGGPLPKGERAILIAIAQRDDGVRREELTVLTGYKRSSRDTYIQRLREKGYVETPGDFIVPTDAGIAALGTDYEPLPTGDALRAHWLQRLPEGERRILEVLIGQFPNAVSRDTLVDAIGYKRSSRDTYLRRLSSRRLVETIGRGEVRASETLFDGATA